MKQGERLFRFFAFLMLHEFCGTVMVRFEQGNAIHVETETLRK